MKSYFRCGISSAALGSQDDELLDHFPLSKSELKQEVADLLFSDSDSDAEFEGFIESEMTEDY